ncbi:hypothetical protein HLK59_12115 [Streptomyces sp. S3(2020)]|uniref:hypothetical protein n=1 Tax=Streptomyces sp. S3(2020) TaxID=2732044 RepID=UPI0014899DCE|nr:hypothetical protein [Streptomyces sp. S3(2020)]NNN31105.1 hypothetical protein [Streptomyces sp. S3(2020)]
MSGTLDRQAAFGDGTWPWERPVARTHGWAAVGEHLGRVWSLSALTVVVLVGGYSWLGLFLGRWPGALIGAAVGMVVCGGLHLAVNRAVSGPSDRRAVPGSRRPGP